MSEKKWISLKIVLDKILRDPLFIGMTYEYAIDYMIDFMTIVGAPELFEEKLSKDLTFDNYRAELPTDFIEEVQIIVDKNVLQWSTDTYINQYNSINVNLNDEVDNDSLNFTYKIRGNYIYFSKKKGTADILYKSIKVNEDEESDEYGDPMIIDDPVFILALQSYIELQFLKILFRAGKISGQVLDEAKQTYAWNVGRYETHSKKLTIGKMEAVSRLFRTIHVKNNEFATRFKNQSFKS